MVKLLLIGLMLVQATLQVEFAVDNLDLSSTKDVPKKDYKKDYNKKSEYKDHSSELTIEKYGNKKGQKTYDFIEKLDDMERSPNEYHKKKYKEGEKIFYSEDKQKKHHKKKRNDGNSLQVTRAQHLQESSNTKLNDKTDVRIEPESEKIKTKKADFYKEMQTIDLSSPPDPSNPVLMARYIVHNIDWGAIATVTSRSGLKHSPFATIISTSDGPPELGSGVPFFYMSPLELSLQDLMKENKASFTVTLAQTDFCRKQNLDPQSPLCARLTLSGKMKRIKANTSEAEFARNALFSRHPEMKTWPEDHEFHFTKLKINEIILLDKFGGPTYLDVAKYLHPLNATSNNAV